MNETSVVFVEHSDVEVTDKPHCGGCVGEVGSVVTDKPHCGGCIGQVAEVVTDKPHCGGCIG